MDLVRCSRMENRSSRLLNSDGLLIEILSRLPSPAAVRFKQVCKRWCSLISSPYFVAFFGHRRHDPSLPPFPDPDSSSYTLLIQFKYHDGLINHYSRALLVLRRHRSKSHPVMDHNWLNFRFLPCPNKHRLSVDASCGDLILCSYSHMLDPESQSTNYYVCNLRTKQWVSLPAGTAHHPISNYTVGLLCVPSPCSICHSQKAVENSPCKFMVLRIRCPMNDAIAIPRTQIQVEIFSSEEGQWKSYVVTSPEVLLFQQPLNYIVPFKGMLHWLNYPYIVVFDPCNAPGEISRLIRVKIDIRARTLPFIDCFGVYYGRLRVSHSTNPIYQCIWELVDYDTGKWSLVHRYGVPEDNWVYYVHLDGNTIYGKVKSSVWISNLLTEGMDQKFELVRGQRGELCHVSAHLIGNEGWPTTVPSIHSSPE